MNPFCNLPGYAKIQGPLLVFEHDLSRERKNDILSRVEQNIDSGSGTKTIKRRVLRVAVEAFQNVVNHKPESRTGASLNFSTRCFLAISKRDTHYTIMTGNPVGKRAFPSLVKRLSHLNRLGRKELRTLYLSRLKRSVHSPGSGAGLGLIDMARKSGEKLWFTFPSYDKDHYFFQLNIDIAIHKNQ